MGELRIEPASLPVGASASASACFPLAPALPAPVGPASLPAPSPSRTLPPHHLGSPCALCLLLPFSSPVPLFWHILSGCCLFPRMSAPREQRPGFIHCWSPRMLCLENSLKHSRSPAYEGNESVSHNCCPLFGGRNRHQSKKKITQMHVQL